MGLLRLELVIWENRVHDNLMYIFCSPSLNIFFFIISFFFFLKLSG